MDLQELRFVVEIVRKAVSLAGNPMELAIEINASEKAIYKWMNGSNRPDAIHLLRILRYLGLLQQ